MLTGMALRWRAAATPGPHRSDAAMGTRQPCARCRSVSAEGDGVHQPALVPQPVQAARQLQRAGLADIALEDLAVIPDRLDGVQHPAVVEAEAGAELAAGAQQALRHRVRALRLLL